MSKLRFIDAGANLTDPNYRGIYNTSCHDPPKKFHKADLQQVLDRSWEAGIEKIIITSKTLSDGKEALDIAKKDGRLYITVGCSPTNCNEFVDCNEFVESSKKPNLYLEQLKNLIILGGKKVVAVGECGLDFDSFFLSRCSRTIQLKYFELQLSLCSTFNLPVILYCREAATVLCKILVKYPGLKGMIRGFDGSSEDANKFLDVGFYIGLNAWSLSTEENLKMVKRLPVEKIILETNCPFYIFHRSFEGYKYVSKENLDVLCVKKEKWRPDFMVNTRDEPCNIRRILDVVARVRNEEIDKLSEQIYENTIQLFFSEESN